jgi:ketosteroid isomerase-like protein
MCAISAYDFVIQGVTGPNTESTMHPNEKTISRFYTAFEALDADTMASCYAEDAIFDDPGFSLRGKPEISGMWHMLCTAAKGNGRENWRLEFRELRANDDYGRAIWEAHYQFSATKRQVHNIIGSDFTFTPEGLIATQRDHFDFWRWSRQALGLGGVMLGWTPFFQKQMRKQTRAALDRYLDKHL